MNQSTPTLAKLPNIASLSPDKLSHIANKGLVKRAQKALEKGDIPSLSTDDDLTLTASFDDGNQVTWQIKQAINDSQCDCPAIAHSLCRHQLQTALTYRQYYQENFGNPDDQQPAIHTLTAEDICQYSNDIYYKNTRQRASKLCQPNISIILSDGEQEPCATARLPMATVRFWGGALLQECICDCHKKQGCEHILLASIAFVKAGDTLQNQSANSLSVTLTADDVSNLNNKNSRQQNTQQKNSAKNNTLDTNTNNTPTTKAPSNQQASKTVDKKTDKQIYQKLTQQLFSPQAIQHVFSLLSDEEQQLFCQLYQFGISGNNIGDGIHANQQRLANIRQDCQKKQYIWLMDIIDDLQDWLTAYQIRRSDFDFAQGNRLIADYLLRRLAGQQTEFSQVSLGVGLKHTTNITTTQLLSLGCQIQAYADTYHAQTMLLDIHSHSLSLLYHTWSAPQTQSQTPSQTQPQQRQAPIQTNDPVTNQQKQQQIRQQSLAPQLTLAELQHGLLTSQRGKRYANHRLTLNKTRRAYNQRLPYTVTAEQLSNLPTPIRFATIAQLKAHYQKRTPNFIQPRYQHPDFVILPIAQIHYIGYDPAEQRVAILVTDTDISSNPDSTPSHFWIQQHYRKHTPYALEMLCQAFLNDRNDDSKDSLNSILDNKDLSPHYSTTVHHVAGTLSWQRYQGQMMAVITPWAIFHDDQHIVPSIDLPAHLSHSNNKQSAKEWLSQLPCIDLSEINTNDTSSLSTFLTNPLTKPITDSQTLLSACQHWLDDALLCGSERLSERFWYERQQLIQYAGQIGHHTLATWLNQLQPNTTNPKDFIIILMAITVMSEVAHIGCV
ncbi:hypothetical protein [Psychrobacter sp. I-STPA10]|uniref:hypothetical protein n=1 Tax=Psychrobacter sp. I-STPA10 TaxID=2585769 RepID=UPI001E4B34D8|nr:hypothetical protein [Psychrobacter sp. I-STPA10]